MAYAPYADLLWLETKSPDLEQARYFARKIREKYPGKYVVQIASFDWPYHTFDRWFVYNLSPSFNWSQHGFTGSLSMLLSDFDASNSAVDVDLKTFIWELAKEG
jgi:isocitrate lyase